MTKINKTFSRNSIRIIAVLLVITAAAIGVFFGSNNVYSYEVGEIVEAWTDIGINDGDISAELSVTAVSDDGTPSYKLTLTGQGDMNSKSLASAYPWYQYRTMITEISIDPRLTKISNQAFQGASKLASVSFGDNSQLAVIESDAFYGCSSLEYVTVPSTVTSLGNSAFSNCSNLLDVTFTEGSVLESIGNSAFARCVSLKTINVPDSVKNIGLQAFYSCSLLEDTKISESSLIESIGYQAFDGCKSLKSIVIPINLQSIDTKMFNGCTNLSNVTIASNAKLKTIGNYAFAGCTNLLNINIPDTVESIGQNAFYSCSKLTDVNITDNSAITSIAVSTFGNCEALKTINFPNGLKSIESSAFQNCYVLNNIEFPIGLESIGEYAFEGCWALSKALIPEGVTVVSKYAFNKCKALTEITIPSTVDTLNEYTFANCTSLESITIPESVTVLENRVFSDCTKLKTVTLPSNLKSIGERVFNNCSLLDGVVIPSTVTEIGSSAFYGCKALSAIEIPTGISKISESLFYGCTGLLNIEIPNNISLIEDNAFYGCSGLTDVTIHISRGEGVKFGAKVFNSTEALSADKIVYVLDNAESLGYTLNGVTFGTVALTGDEENRYTHTTKPSSVIVKSNYKPDKPQAYIGDVSLDDGETYSYNESKLVTIKRAEGTESSYIYYTLDGSEPTEDNGIKYTEPFLIDKTCTLKYRVAEIGCISSDIASANIEIKRTLTYDYSTNGGGSSTILSQTVQYGDTVSLDITADGTAIAQKDGYVFLGWNTDKDAHTVLKSITGFEDDTTVYAIYKKTVSAVFRNLSSNDKILSVDYYNKEDISQATVKAPSISRKTGWTVKGWRFAKNEEFGDTEPRPDIYAANSNVPIRDGDMFEVVYTKDIKLVYNLNGSGATSSIENEICTLSSYTITEGIDRSIAYFTVTDKVPTRSGYFFNGWGGTAAATAEEYVPGDTILTESLEDNFTIYAIWTQKSYTLTETEVSGSFSDLNYGYQTSNAVIYTITNAGNSDVTNLKASIKTSDFTLSPLSRTSLLPGETATITVTFPKGKDAGTYTDVLTITGDNVREPLGINLSQKVIPRTISIKSASVADKVYDGQVLGTVEAIEFDGIDGYNFTVSDYTVKAEFSDPNVSFNSETGEVTEKNAVVIVTLKKSNFILEFNEYPVKAKILRAEVPSIPEDSITAKCSHNNLSQVTDMLPEDWTWNEFSAITSGNKYLAVYKDINNYNNSSKEVTVYISTVHTYDSRVTIKPTCVTFGEMTYTCACGDTYTEPIDKDPKNHINTTSTVKTPANCVKEGVMEYTCNDCGAVYEGSIAINPLNHKGYVGKVIAEATCQRTGTMRYMCYCGDYYDVTIEKNSEKHEYVTTITKVPTCNEEGAANYDCPCGDHYSAPLAKDPKNHTGYEGVVTKLATCQNEGVKTYTCGGCGDTYTEPIEKNPSHHEDYSFKDTTPATCQNTGIRTYTCICGHSYEEDIPIDRNNHVDYTDEVLEKPTCIKTGITRHTCACGYYYDEVTPINYNNHSYIPEVIEQPSCVSPGKIKYTCKDCGYYYMAENVKDPTNHTVFASSITTEPTCQHEGVMTYTCEGCGYKYTEDISKDPNNHKDFKSKILKVATCKSEGKREYTCLCGYFYTEPMPIDSQRHEYPITYKTTVMPTCTKSGERLCTYACGHSYTEEIPVNLNNHSYEGVVEAEPTCQAEGVMRYTCHECKKSYTEPISKNPNRHVDYTQEVIKTANCSEYGEIKYTCLCGYSYIEETAKNPLAHSQLVTRIEKVPNCVETGEQILRCTGCGYEETEILPIDSENHTHYSEVVEEEATCISTGIMRHTCDGCGADYTTTIPLDPFNHSFVDGVCENCGSTEDEVILSKVKSEYDGSSYSWEYKVKVKEGIAESPVLIFAAYGLDGAVVGITITDIEPTENAVSVTGVTECSAPAKTYKIFLWDGTEHIRPLTYITK